MKGPTAPGMEAAAHELQRSKGTKYNAEIVETCLYLINNRGFKEAELIAK